MLTSNDIIIMVIILKLTYLVKENDKGKLLKDILKKKLYISNILLNKLKLTNSIFVNNVSKYVNYILNENDTIIIDFENMSKAIYQDKTTHFYKKDAYLYKYERYEYNLDILYEDEYLLIINKPSFMPVHPSCTNYKYTLSNAVATYLEKKNIFSIHIVTRLDKNTSGICIFAKNAYIQELFIRKKENISIKKEYLAIANGKILKNHDIIQKNISRKKDSIIVREINNEGDFAKTEYFVKKRNYDRNYTVIKVLLHTGRTHQIRVHMASINHVLLGDSLYAKEYNIQNIDKYINRQALHSYKVTFTHPITNKIINIQAPIPDDIKNLI